MANVELELISNVIRDGDMLALNRVGFNAAQLQTEEAREMLRWLSAEFMNPQTPGRVPSIDRVRRRFPEFDYRPTRDPVLVQVQEILDNGVAAGIRAAFEDMEALLDEGESPQVVLEAFLPQLRDLRAQGGEGAHLMMSRASRELREDYERMRDSGGLTGIPFPWAPLNKATAGMQPEDFIVVYARPKEMKTWTALSICAHAYKAGRRVLVYSKEMARRAMARRASALICEVDYEQVKQGALAPGDEEAFFDTLDSLEDWEKATSLSGHKAAMSFMDDKALSRGKGGVTVDMLRAEAERFEADMILVDGFYLMKDGRTQQRSREWKQISNISSDLKDMAQSLKVPVIGTTQANRGASKTSGDDVSEVGYADAIGQDTDLLIRVFKSTHLATGKPKLMLTFPGARDAVLNPFVINAWPGKDFSLLQSSVDVEAFLKDKKQFDETTAEHQGGAAQAGGPDSPGARRFGAGKSGPRQKVSTRIRE